jgi:transposase
VAKTADGNVEAIRVLLVAYRSGRDTRIKCLNQLRHLGFTGDNAERITSEAAFAHLCGVAPIHASSGKVTRHRLDRGGNRQANHALWRIVFTRMSSDARTRAYVERRLAEGRSKPEIMRVLKRYVAREVYRHLPGVAP